MYLKIVRLLRIFFILGSHKDDDDNVFDIPSATGQHLYKYLKNKTSFILQILKRWKMYKHEQKKTSFCIWNWIKHSAAVSSDNEYDSIFDSSEM